MNERITWEFSMARWKCREFTSAESISNWNLEMLMSEPEREIRSTRRKTSQSNELINLHMVLTMGIEPKSRYNSGRRSLRYPYTLLELLT